MKLNQQKILLMALCVSIIAGVGIFWAKRQPHPPHQQAHKDLYYCPMHPQIQSDKPGSCPICYMKLIKKEEAITEEHDHPAKISQKDETLSAGYTTVKLTTEKMQMINVKTTPVVKKPLTKTIHAYGIVAHDLELYDAQLEYIEAWRVFYAYVVRRPVKESFREDWRDYYVTSAAEGRFRSEDEIKSQQRLIRAEYELKHMGITDSQLAQLREIKYGQPWVRPELLFFEKDQPFWIYAQVSESDLGFIAPTQKVIATIEVYNEKTEGVIRSIAPFVDPVTRTSRVRIEMPAYKGELSVNMYVDVDIPVELNESLIVPREAIMDTGLRKIIFVESSKGVFEPRQIQTGLEGDAMVAVKEGLKEGEMIAVSGNFLLDSESRLKSAIENVNEHKIHRSDLYAGD